MIVIIASSYDAGAAELAECWRAEDARLLTPRDLSQAGWHYRPGFNSDKAVIAGKIVTATEISAVLTCLSGVWSGELRQIVPADREYIAEEMTAFLMAWLNSLGPRVHNRPTPLGLAGPTWRSETWRHLAGQAGILTKPTRRQVAPGMLSELQQVTSNVARVTVIGDVAIGEADRMVKAQAIKLASLAKVELLTTYFD